MRERTDASAPGEEPFDDLTVELGWRKLEKLSDDQKDQLRQIGRARPPQIKVENLKWEVGEEVVENPVDDQKRIEAIQDCIASLLDHADPIPASGGYLYGIEHFNSLLSRTSPLQDVVRAIHSKKMHYFPKVKQKMEAHQGLAFNKSFPDMSPASGGTKRLSEEGWQTLKTEWQLSGYDEYVKHICELHAGEARLVGETWWQSLEGDLNAPASGGEYKKACFWHCQFMSHVDAKQFLHSRGQEEWGQEDLSDADIDWVMKMQGDETAVLKRE